MFLLLGLLGCLEKNPARTGSVEVDAGPQASVDSSPSRADGSVGGTDDVITNREEDASLPDDVSPAPDADVDPDAGEDPDAEPAPDAEQSDAGDDPDANPDPDVDQPDVGEEPDAGNDPDADVDPDAGEDPDAGPVLVDNDGDGVFSDEDCNDNNPNIHPGASELCDGLDNDCNEFVDDNPGEDNGQQFWEDFDNDSYGTPFEWVYACEQPEGYSDNAVDCNDDDGDIHPNQEEVADGVDNDCDTIVDEGTNAFDDDGDGFSEDQGDCDDGDIEIHPDAVDLCGDGVDQDCSGEDLVCPFPDTTVTVSIFGGYPAMTLTVETYASAAALDQGWDEQATVFDTDEVSVVLDSDEYAVQSFCGLRVNLAAYHDQQDINNGEIVGNPDSWLCQLGGDNMIDPASTISVMHLGIAYTKDDFQVWIPENEQGCSALLVFNDEGDCAL